MCAGEGGSGDSRRAEGRHKRPRLVWTAELHARFMNAVNHLVRPHTCLCPSRASLHRKESTIILKHLVLKEDPAHKLGASF